MNLFSKVGNQAKTTIRFSTVGGESGSADTARDPRGFAIKVRTEEGNWDIGELSLADWIDLPATTVRRSAAPILCHAALA